MTKLKFKNINVHYTDQGKGEVMVLLHGFLEDLSMWDEVIKSLATSCRIICVDLLGHGGTENLGYIHSMEDQAAMVKHVLDYLGIRKCDLAGHSMGGYVALAVADLYPGIVSGLCLMNSTALPDDQTKKRNRDRGIKAVKQNHKTFIRLAIPNLFSEENRAVFTEEINEITDKALNMSQQGIISAIEGMKIRKDRTHLLRNASFPVFMIIGKKDPALDYLSLLEQATLENIEKVVFDDGHMSHIENRETLISALEYFKNMSLSQ